MTAIESLAPDVEGALRDYLRADILCQTVFNGRVFFGFNDSAYPAATLMRIGGGMDASEANVDHALIQIDVWGEVRSKANCWAATSAVLAALRNLREGYDVAGKAKIYSTGAKSWAWLPDPASERSRYSVTVTVTGLPSDEFARLVAMSGSHLVDDDGDEIVV